MATFKSSAVTQLAEMTDCCICLKTFTDPRTLQCIHTFCFHCLQDMVDKSDKKPGDEIQCPMCRKEFTLPKEGVQGIQKNFFMAGLIEVRSALNQSMTATITCDACTANNEGIESKVSKATLRCFDCQENLCEDCYKMHKAFKMLRNHKLLKIDSSVGYGEAVKTLSAMNCDIHRSKLLDYYCAECEKLVCVSCFVESHQTHDCNDVNTVEEEFRQVIKSCSDKISVLAGELLAKKEKRESKEYFLGKIAEREKDILRRRDELKEMIDEHAKSLLNSLEEMKNRQLKEIQASEDELDRHLIIVESFKIYCDELSSKGSASDVCRNKDELLRRAEVIEEDHETYVMRPYISNDVIFVATDLKEVIKTTNGNTIGSLREKDESSGAFAVIIAKAGHTLSSHTVNLHCKSDNVSPIEDVPTTVRSFPDAAVYNNTMFITGIGEVFNEIWKYNFSSGWRRCGSLVQGRHCHCAEFLDETLYICGGRKESPNSVTNHIEAYNAVTEKSKAVGKLKIGCDMADCVAHKGSIYVFGGNGKGRKRLDCVQVFNTVEKTCTLLSTPIPRPTADIRALSWNDYAILLGKDTCFVFDFRHSTWQERNQFKTHAKAARFGMILENERFFFIEGLPYAAFISDYLDADRGIRIWTNKDIKYIKASSIVNNEAPIWRLCGRLPLELKVCAVPKMSLVK